MNIYKAGLTFYRKSTANYGAAYQNRTIGYYKNKEKADRKLKEHITKCEVDPDFKLVDTWVQTIKVE